MIAKSKTGLKQVESSLKAAADRIVTHRQAILADVKFIGGVFEHLLDIEVSVAEWNRLRYLLGVSESTLTNYRIIAREWETITQLKMRDWPYSRIIRYLRQRDEAKRDPKTYAKLEIQISASEKSEYILSGITPSQLKKIVFGFIRNQKRIGGKQ